VAASHGLTLPGLKRLVDTDVINVSSKSFGLKVIDQSSGREGVTNLVFVDDPVPKAITRDFSTHVEGQTEVKLEVFENHDRNTDADALLDPEAECTLLGEAQLSFLQALPQGSPIEVTFELTPDGLLKLHGKDLTTHQEIQADFKTESLMPAEDMASAKSHALGLQVS
jgi:molecular chaperone DnaK (HSP70)